MLKFLLASLLAFVPANVLIAWLFVSEHPGNPIWQPLAVGGLLYLFGVGVIAILAVLNEW